MELQRKTHVTAGGAALNSTRDGTCNSQELHPQVRGVCTYLLKQEQWEDVHAGAVAAYARCTESWSYRRSSRNMREAQEELELPPEQSQHARGARGAGVTAGAVAECAKCTRSWNYRWSIRNNRKAHGELELPQEQLGQAQRALEAVHHKQSWS
jgi:hypothetical protein